MSKQGHSDRAAAAQVVAAAAAADARRRKLAAIVAGLLVVIVAGYLWSASRTKPEPPTSVVPSGVTEAYGVKYGEGEPEVVIYEDFLCPFCGELEREHLGAVTQAVADGTASVEYRPINLLAQISDYSLRATNAYFVVLDTAGAEAAGKFHTSLFENQPAEDGEQPDDEWLIEQAVAAGADEDQVRGPITELKFGDYVTNATESVLLNDKIKGTPTVYVDGKQIEGTADEIESALTAAIAEAN